MKFEKALPRAPVVLSCEEHRRVVQYVGLLVAVAKRADSKKALAKRANVRFGQIQCVSDSKRKSSGRKDTGLKELKIKRVRNFYEPCFFEQTIYPETGNLKSFCISNILISRDYHDRHHSFNIGQQHVSHYGT